MQSKSCSSAAAQLAYGRLFLDPRARETLVSTYNIVRIDPLPLLPLHVQHIIIFRMACNQVVQLDFASRQHVLYVSPLLSGWPDHVDREIQIPSSWLVRYPLIELNPIVPLHCNNINNNNQINNGIRHNVNSRSTARQLNQQRIIQV